MVFQREIRSAIFISELIQSITDVRTSATIDLVYFGHTLLIGMNFISPPVSTTICHNECLDFGSGVAIAFITMVSHIELLFTNFFIIALLYFLEKAYSKGKTSIRTINYEIIEHIKPENEHLLLAELQNRTGKEVIKYEILETDYLKDAALISVHLK